MRNTLFLILFAYFLGACASDQKKEVHSEAKSGLLLENMDTTVRPGDNFQLYVNGNWMKNTEIPADKSSYGVFHMLHEKSQEHVKEIIEVAAEANAEKGTDEQKLGDLYASYMDMERRNQLKINPLKEEFQKIEQLSSYNDLIAYFGYAVRYGYGTPVGLFVYPDMKNPTVYALYNWQGGLGLPDREYYLSDEGKFPSIREAYVKHIEAMLSLAGIEGGAKKAKKIMALETSLAKNHLKKEETRDMNKLYNMYPVDSLNGLMTNFDWRLFLEAVGIKELDKIVIAQPTFTMAVNELIPATDMDTWKTYLKWGVINDAASQLDSAMDAQNFDFYSKTLNGIQEQLPLWRRAVNVVNGNMGEVVGKVYVSKHFPPEAKERMQRLVDNLIKAYEVSINELDWMSDETKVQALDKLSKFRPKIGYPDKWKDYSALHIERDDLFGNIRRAELVEHNRELAKVGQPIDKSEWGMTPQTVNAYYSPALNEIVFPAAILQPPFFNLAADDAVNYGAIGGVIGHEIGHGFDDQGSKFDGDGVLRNWWTDTDREEFKKRTAALIGQYDAFKVLADLNVNGEFTLGENIGDLGGLSIALKAYHMSLGGEEAPVMDGFTGTQRVFLGWGQAWLSKSREEALRTLVNTDPHSPAKFRVNGVVRNIPEFYEAFNVTASDSLYLPAEERVKIW